MSAMERFQYQEQDMLIVREGFGALLNLAGNKENCTDLVRDALPTLLVFMSSFRDKVGIIFYACRLLANLTTFPEVRQAMIDAKALSVLSHAVENHGKHPEIPKVANRATKNLLQVFEE
jgi:enhancing lycopene biosynthesis protein 2